MANKVPFYYDPEEFKNWVYYSERCSELDLDVLRLTSVVEVLTTERDKEAVKTEELKMLLSSRDEEITNTQLMLLEDVREALRVEYDNYISEKVQLRCRISELEEEVAILEEDNSFLQHEHEKSPIPDVSEQAIDPQPLQELQNVIGQLTSNWRLAMDNEKTLAGQLAELRLHRDSLSDRLSMFEEDTRIWEIHRSELVRVRNELIAQRDTLRELPTLRLQFKQTMDENASLKRLLKEKITDVEKAREEALLRGTQMEFMRKHYESTKGEVSESVALQAAESTLRTHKYELLKQRYKALRENLSIALPLISAFAVSLSSIRETQMHLFRKLRSFADQEAQIARIREELLFLKKPITDFDEPPDAFEDVQHLEEEINELCASSGTRCITEEFEDTGAKVASLLEKLQSKDFFVISPEDEFSPTPYEETEEVSLRGRVVQLESEAARLRTELVAFKSRSETLDQVERLVATHFPTGQDIVRTLGEALGQGGEGEGHSQQMERREDAFVAESE